MPLINCKVELKLEWIKYCVLAIVGVDNINVEPIIYIIFTIKGRIFYVAVATLSEKRQWKTIKTP